MDMQKEFEFELLELLQHGTINFRKRASVV